MRYFPRGRPLLAGILLATPLVLVSCFDDNPSGPRQQVPVTLSNHSSGPVSIDVEDGDCNAGGLPGVPHSSISPNGGWRILTLSMQDGQVVPFKVYTVGGPLLGTVECKWRGETHISVDYQVPQGSQVAQLLCIVWHGP